eukprot:6377500-Amphidinium_carterae.1
MKVAHFIDSVEMQHQSLSTSPTFVPRALAQQQLDVYGSRTTERGASFSVVGMKVFAGVCPCATGISKPAQNFCLTAVVRPSYPDNVIAFVWLGGFLVQTMTWE